MHKTMVNITLMAVLAWLCSESAAAKPLKVFVLAGQSNMQGHAKVATFDSMATDPETALILKEMRVADGTPRVCDQVVFQGWNGMVDSHVYPNRGKSGGYDLYSELLAQFIRDVREDLSAPRMPFVIGVMGVGGVKSKPDHFREAMAAPALLPEFQGNVSVVLTEKYWDPDLGELDKRWERVRNKSRAWNKDTGLTRAERAAALDEFTAQWFTPQELMLRETAMSNAGYHYLGSAKIMAQIGKAFAEALDETMGADETHQEGTR